MRRVLLDCDNTLGIPRREIDDGLLIMYLLGHPQLELVGITTTAGNGTIEEVETRTRELLARLGRSDIPVVRGAARAGDWDTPAASFIAQSAADEARVGRRLDLLATGPLGNVYGAMRHGLSWDSVAGVYAMGGYLGRLRFLRREVRELNLSFDARASYEVIRSAPNLTLMSAQICLQARFGPLLMLRSLRYPAWLRRPFWQWYAAFCWYLGTAGFYLWDLLPAWFITDPLRFRRRYVRVLSTVDDLEDGKLRLGRAPSETMKTGVTCIPERIRFGHRFAGDCARVWERAVFSLGRL